jgi:hypothetical protein
MSRGQKGLGYVGGALITAVITLMVNSLVAPVLSAEYWCRQLDGRVDITRLGCTPDMLGSRPVSAEEAALFFSHFFAAAAGPDPDVSGWALLTSDAKREFDHEPARFVVRWDEYVWAEVAGVPKPTGTANTFDVQVNVYALDGRVSRRQYTMPLARDGGRLRVNDHGGSFEEELLREAGPWPWAVLNEDAAQTYQMPAHTAPVAMSRDRFTAGGHLDALCQLADDTGTWWIRTTHGWIPSDWTEAAGTPYDELRECEPNHLVRAANHATHDTSY